MEKKIEKGLNVLQDEKEMQKAPTNIEIARLNLKIPKSRLNLDNDIHEEIVQITLLKTIIST